MLYILDTPTGNRSAHANIRCKQGIHSCFCDESFRLGLLQVATMFCSALLQNASDIQTCVSKSQCDCIIHKQLFSDKLKWFLSNFFINFLPHPKSVCALPGESRTNEILPFSPNAVLMLDLNNAQNIFC